MINEGYRNAFFGAASIAMLLSSIKHSEYIYNNLSDSLKYYSKINFTVTVTFLFVNICLGIFALFIVGNLNDFFARMSLNLIGSCQKIRVLAILMTISCVCYTGSSSASFISSIFENKTDRYLSLLGCLVSVSQILHLVSMNCIHPDLFGLKWKKQVKDFDAGRLSREYFL